MLFSKKSSAFAARETKQARKRHVILSIRIVSGLQDACRTGGVGGQGLRRATARIPSRVRSGTRAVISGMPVVMSSEPPPVA